jgi:hypothetical protein
VKLLHHLLVLVLLSGFMAAAILSHLPAAPAASPGLADVTAARDLLDVLSQAAIKRSSTLEITEGELNRYLADAVRGTQGGRTGRLYAFDRASVDIEAGSARVTLHWRGKSHPATTSLELTVLRSPDKKAFRVEIQRGAYGRLAVARGFLLPLMPAYESLASACDPEVKALFQMTKIELAKDKVVLDSKF